MNINKRVYVENKYRPVFYQCGSARIKEAEPPGTVVSQVSAYDNDTDSAGEIFFTILRAGYEKEFEVDPATGVIRSSKVIDYLFFSFFFFTKFTTTSRDMHLHVHCVTVPDDF